MSTTIWVFSAPGAPHLSVLDQLPPDTKTVVSDEPSAFANRPAPDCILNCTGNGKLLDQLWEQAGKARWIHSLYAGVEHMVTPRLRDSPVPLTNSRGVFKRTLGEFVIGGCLFFAKDFRRMLRNQAAGMWEQYDLEELYGKTMGIAGYGEIGRAVAQRAKPFGMKILGIRRRPEMSDGDNLVDEVYGFSGLASVLPRCDYLVIATPLTPETIGLIGEAQLRSMKRTAVLANVGRGPVVDEPALIRALQEGWIRAAVLDVFDKEPLPAGHPFYRLENVLLSPHCADHTSTWLHEAVEFFIANLARFEKGEPLLNLVDKHAGY